MRSNRQVFDEIKAKVDIYLGIARFDAAEKLVKTKIAEDTTLANMHHLLGLIYHKQSRFVEAIDSFKNAIDLNPRYIEASLNLAITLCDLGQYEEAHRVIKDVCNPRNFSKNVPWLSLGRLANHHAQSGRAYENLGLLPEAIQEYRRAISLFPEMPDIKLSLAKLYLKTSHFGKAQKELEEIVAIDPNYPESNTLLGLILYKSGQVDQALTFWKTAQSQNPNDLIARAYLKFYGNHRQISPQHS